jgi:hypothetical protein
LLQLTATPGVLCDLSDRGSVLSAFLGDDFVSSSLDINDLTQQELEQPLKVDDICYGVASTTFDIM